MSHDWWKDAACAGRDPEWWSGDPRTGRAAVEVCLDCPVREPCLREALAAGDCEVIRGGMLFTLTRHGKQAISLVCGHCLDAPVMTTSARFARFCSPACGSAARRLAATRLSETVTDQEHVAA
jgi:hypothetical protein